MKKTHHTTTTVGMLLGMFAGSGLGVVLFANTGNPVYFTLSGVGLVIGLLLGAGSERQR